jgi:transcriptional regulator with XRE-family HTH domain
MLTKLASGVKADESPEWRWRNAHDEMPNPGMPNRIRELRVARKLTMATLADRVGTSEQQISRIERGHRRLTDDWMRRIATALDVHPFELLMPDAQDVHRSPQDLQDVEILRVWRRLDQGERRMVAKFLESLATDPEPAAGVCSTHQPKRRRA